MFNLRVISRNGGHVHFTIFANGANCGELTMTPAEFEAFSRQLGCPVEGDPCPVCGHPQHLGAVCMVVEATGDPCCCDAQLDEELAWDEQDRPYRWEKARVEPAADDQLESALEHAHALVKSLAWALTGMIALVKDVGERPGMPETCRGAVKRAQDALRQVPSLLREDLGDQARAEACKETSG